MLLNMALLRQVMALCFSVVFFIFAAFLTGLTLQEFWLGLTGDEHLIGAFVKAINTAVIALATFELGLVVTKEYGGQGDAHILTVLRRTVPRFVSIVAIALVLEGLLLVIKYSQLDLAGNLYYPVAIIIAASILLTSLGLFLRFTHYPLDSGHELREPDAQEQASLVPFTVKN